MEARAQKLETIVEIDGVILFPGLKPGEHIEVTVVHQDPALQSWPKRVANLRP